jgi:hypothetical protein
VNPSVTAFIPLSVRVNRAGRSTGCCCRAGLGGYGALTAILTAAYHMIKDGTLYHDLGPDHFDRRAKAIHIRRLITRLEKLGYTVQITPMTA